MCFSMFWVGHLVVWIIVLLAVVAVLRLLIPWALSLVGVNLGPLPQILNIIIGAAIAIAVVWFVIELLSCLMVR